MACPELTDSFAHVVAVVELALLSPFVKVIRLQHGEVYNFKKSGGPTPC